MHALDLGFANGTNTKKDTPVVFGLGLFSTLVTFLSLSLYSSFVVVFR